MPGGKRLLRRIRVRADLSQMLVKVGGLLQTKNGPGNRGHSYREIVRRAVRLERPSSKIAYFLGSETETGEVAIADGNPAAGGQQTVDRGHQTAEQGAGGQEADGCSLGHVCPLFLVRTHSAS